MSIPIKIYVGTSPQMKKAEIVLEYSIKKYTKDPVEIVWMDFSKGGLWAGWDIGRAHGRPDLRRGWATDYSAYRFAIPQANHFEGRAIYLDVDMILLRDIKEIWEFPLLKPVIGVKGGMSLLLFDCSRFKECSWWPKIHEMKTNKMIVADYLDLLYKNHMISNILPPHWNCLNGQNYDPEETALIHYSNMLTQPWKPYPELFPYDQKLPPDVERIWWEMYEAASNII